MNAPRMRVFKGINHVTQGMVANSWPPEYDLKMLDPYTASLLAFAEAQLALTRASRAGVPSGPPNRSTR